MLASKTESVSAGDEGGHHGLAAQATRGQQPHPGHGPQDAAPAAPGRGAVLITQPLVSAKDFETVGALVIYCLCRVCVALHPWNKFKEAACQLYTGTPFPLLLLLCHSWPI